MKQLIFKEKNHEYFGGDVKYNSVSKIVGHFRDAFDPEFMGPYCALKEFYKKELKEAKTKFLWNDPEIIKYVTKDFDYLEYTDLINKSDELRWTWDENSKYGTDIHAGQENLHLKRGWFKCPLDGETYKVIRKRKIKGADNYYFLEKALSENKCNFMIPELLLYDIDTESAGQIDNGYFYWNGSFHTWRDGDYKTDKKLEYKPIFVAKVFGGRSLPKRMHNPFSYINDTNVFYYMCKMSMYGLMMCKLGIPPGPQYIVAIPKIGKKEILPLPFVPTIAQKMLNLYYGMDPEFKMDEALAYQSMGKYENYNPKYLYDELINDSMPEKEKNIFEKEQEFSPL